MAQLSMPPIPVKMYRHFAVVTVVLTAFLAFFASGENRDAAAEQATQLVRDPVHAAPTGEPTPAYGEVQLERSSAQSGGFNFSDEFDENSSFGAPMDSPGSSGTGIVRTGPLPDGIPNIPGYSQAYLESLSEEQLRALMAQLEAAGGNDPVERARNTRRLEQSSRQRSGAGEGAEGI